MSRPSRLRIVPGILPAAAVGGLALTCGVALTTTSGWLIVAASHRPQILTLLAAIVLVRAFGIARPALRYAERIRSHDVALSYLAEERARTYARLIPLTPARLGRRSRGDMLAGVVDDLDDVAYAQVRVVVPLVALLVTGLLAAFADAMILYAAAGVTLSTLAWTLLAAWLDHALEASAQQGVLDARAEVSRVSALVAGNGPELAAIGAQRSALSWLDDAHADLGRALARQARGRAVGVSAMPLVTVAHTIGMVAVVEPWVASGLATPLAAFLVLTPVAMGEVVSGVPDAVGALARARGARERLDGILAQRPAVHDPAAASPTLAERTRGAAALPAGDAATGDAAADEATTDEAQDGGGPVEAATTVGTPPRLVLDRASASWDDRRAALPPLTTAFPPGEHVAVVGPNGSGKSTLLAVLARHLDPASGRYLSDGRDVSTVPLATSRSRLAIVDDEPHVFASTLRENLRFARPGCTDEQIESALLLAGLADWYADLPHGLDTQLGAGGQGVSGGERARLSIARALLSARPVLLLDEPVAHLDGPTARAVLRDVKESTRGRSIVLVTHRPEGARDADRVLRLGPQEDAAPPPVAGPR